MADNWINPALRRLVSAQLADGSWGYRFGGGPAVEPTALAALGCLAADPNGKDARVAANRAGAWLARAQTDTGTIQNTPAADAVWPTPLAALLWKARGGFDEQTRRAAQALLQLKGDTFDRKAGDVIGHDTSIPGWPWVSGTHSWVEPTALAILALCAEGLANHERIKDGVRLLQDRVIAGGGWNYGNSEVLGSALRPQPAPTGLALLALNGRNEPKEPLIADSCRYLEIMLPKTRSPQTLCWGIWALDAWGRRPVEATKWISESVDLVDRRPNPNLQLAYLLMASAPPLSVFLPPRGDAS